MSDKRIKAAVIGVGNIGYHHTRIYSGLADIELIGVFDPSLKARQKIEHAFSVPSFSSLYALIDSKPDVVSICVPTHEHFKVAKLCLESGIHCLVEKPLATSLEHIQELAKAAQSRNLVLTVGQVERYNPAVLELKRMIDDDELGEIVHIATKRVGGYPPELTETGVFFDLAVHDLDIILHLYNKEPIRVQSHKLNVFNQQVDDASTMFLEFERATAHIQVNWITPVKMRTLSVTGTKGYAELNFIDQRIDIFSRNVNPNDFEEKDFHEFLHKFSNPEKKTWTPAQKQEPLKNEIQHFIDVVRGNATLNVTVEQAYRTMKWLTA